MKKLEAADNLSAVEAAGRQSKRKRQRQKEGRHSEGLERFTLNIRSSVQVKLVTVLNVEHEVASVQILHDEEEVLLEVAAQRR